MRSHGVTLVELLVVVSILGVVALVAIPNLSSGGAKRLDLATAEVVAAVRYARSEALRSGQIHGIQISQATQRVVVYKADLATDPVSMAVILSHPVDHKPYDFDFDTAAMTAGVSISNEDDPFVYYVAGRRKNLLFDASGQPVWIVSGTGTTWPLEDGMIQLDYRSQQRIVRVATLTGRVSVE